VSPAGTATQTDDGSDLGFRPAAAKPRVPLSVAPAGDDLGFRPATSPENDLGFRPAAPQATSQPPATPQTAAASKGPTIGPAPEPNMWDRLKSSVANSAIGYAVEERLPRLSGALGITPTETASNPYAEQHAHEIIAPGAAFPKPGVAKGVAEFAGGLTTPENVPILAATGGLGALESIIGKAGAGAIGRLVSAGFSASMIQSAVEKWPGFKEAWEKKDMATAQQLATEALLDLAMAHHAFRHAATEPGATPREKFGATLDRTKAVPPEPERPEARPLLRAAPIITPPPAGAVAVPEKTPMPGYLRADPEWLAQNRGLPAGPDTRALPPAPSEAIERAANVNIAPGEKPIPLPAQTPTRIGPGAEPIAAGPSAEAAELGFRPIRKASTEPRAAKSAPTVNEMRPQLAELDARYKRLDDQLRTARSYNTAKQLTAKLRPLSEQRNALRADIEKIEPRPEAKPFTISPDTRTGQVVPERGPAAEKPPESAARGPASPRLATPTWDSLPPEHQEAVRGIMESHEHQPQALQEATDVELKKLSDKGTPLREQFARLHAKDLGLPVHAERAGVTASDFLASVQGAKQEATPFSTTAETPARGPSRSAEAREQRITGGRNATPADMQRTLEEDIRQLEEKTRSAKPGLERQLAEGRLKQNREMLADLRAGKAPTVEPRAAEPSSPELLAKDAGLVYKGEAVKGSGVHQFEHPDFPGATMAMRESDLSTPEALGERMQAKLAEKPIVPKPGETASSVEFMRALSDRKPEAGIATPEMLRDLFSGRLPKEAWQRFVADPVIEKGLGIGEKYAKVREADPEVAGGLHLLDNAPAYFRAKAAQNVHDIIGGLSREQERLFSLMADADSRENLRANHPDEYRRATNDQAIQRALAAYKPVEQELTASRKKVGGATLDQDYLRRVYEEHVAGIGKESAPESSPERATTAFDRVVRPQKIGNLSREATAEYHYQHGLHEFGPAFGTKFIGTHLAALRDQIARDFISKATEISPGAAEPRSITYKGEKYFRPDIAREMRDAGQKDVKAYDRYDPNAGVKYPRQGASKFLGPQEVVRTLNDYGAKRDTGRGPFGRFLQEQTIGFGFGIPHVANILRRVTQSAPLGAANPEAWARAWKVAFDKGLRDRGLEGVDDPTFDKLLQHGAITTGEMANLKSYWGGNLNPANWARTLAGVGHKLIFEPGSFGGVGGIDQRARLYIADLLKSQKPEMSDAAIGKAVNTQLGDYNRQNWNDRQKLMAKFMLFPGWDASSIRWVIEHPIKTTVPPALLVWTANQVLHRLGQNRGEDASDISNIHIGDRSIGVTLLRESMGRNLARPLLNFAQSKIRGESTERAVAEASRGVAQGAGGMVGTLRPDITAGIDLAMNRSSAFGGKELVSPEDYKEPGRVLPNRALEKQAALIVRHAIPALDRMLGSDQEIDFKSFAGSNLGLPNYQDGAEQRLKRNVAESSEVSITIGRLAKTKPDAAREFVQDPDNAAYALFRNELASMTATLKRIDAAKEAVSSAKNLSAREKSERLAQIAKARENLLRNADGLDALLFKRKQEKREKPPAPTLRRPVNENYLDR
jgi:hypothetical protein